MRHQSHTTSRNVLLWLLLSVALPLMASAPASAQRAVDFDGTNDFITFGAAPDLGLAQFTLECWLKREGTGATTSTGTGGVTAVPLVTKGRGEGDGSNVDMNYFVGIDGTLAVLVADFEEGAAGATPGLNHPVYGVTPIQNNVWYHAAVTYDGGKWQLFLNGNLEQELVVGQPPRSDSIQHAGVATAMTSAGIPGAAGFFNGVIDEVRIWNFARTQQEIMDGLSAQIQSAPGLVGRWGMNEVSGNTAFNSVSGGANGALTNGPLWVTDVPPAGIPNVFRQGIGGYAGAVDTWLDGNNASTVLGAAATFRWDGEDPAGGPPDYALLRFDNIFGTNPGQLPPNATIVSAQLRYSVSNAANDQGNPANVYEVMVDWDGNTTYSNFGGDGGVQPDEYGNFVASAPATALDTAYQIDVTPSLAAWAAGTSSNRGWVFIATGTDGSVIRSSENATEGGRPLLAVYYLPPVTSPPSAPSGLSASETSFYQIQLAWADNSDNEASFEIERSTAGIGGPFSLLTSVSANTSAYDDQTVEPEKEYCYRVRAVNILGPSAYSDPPACATTGAEPANALDFGGTNAYVSFGQTSKLGLANFTIECWFKREGAGATTTTGTGGITSAIPLVTKGRGEAEGSNVDMNYFLGIDAATGVLAADFEEGASGTSPGLNHPVSGITAIQNGVWYHAAATYDGNSWRLFLNGELEKELYVGQPTRSDSIQHAGIATAMTSTGAAAGFFDGVIDEVRIWNHSRTQAQILDGINSQITIPQSGLVARWGLNEGSGKSIHGTAGTAVSGAIMGAAYAWVAPGAPFDLVVNRPPDQPTLVAPTDHAPDVALSPTLSVNVSDPEATPMTVEFYGRPAGGESFSIVVLPDTQFYSESYLQNYKDQTQWIVNSLNSLNIAYVAHLGDIVNVASTVAQWTNADAAMAILENPATTGLPDGIPYGIVPGNHDQPTTNYNTYFGISRFSSRDYYGGNFNGLDNDNNYTLFSVGGMDFIVVNLEYNTSTPPDPAVLSWANTLLQTNGARRAIIVSHNIIGTGNPGTFSSEGQAIYDALKNNSNLFLMLCGHVAGEGYRLETRTGMNPVHILLADYQSRSNGGDGYLRILEFVPEADQIRVKTYSPVLGLYETDADSQFNLSYDMPGEGFQLLGVNVGVPSASTASIPWPAPGLNPFREYEWYVTVSDGDKLTTGPIWSFSTTGILGDTDGDCDVDGLDLVAFLKAYGTAVGNPNYNPKADIEPIGGDGDVDVNDLYEFAFDYGTVGCP